MELTSAHVLLQPSVLGLDDEMILMPIGDVQHGAPGSNLEKMKRHLDWGMRLGAQFISMGDMVDMSSPSERRALAKLELHDSTRIAMEEKAQTHEDEVKAVLKGTEGRWLAFHKGHHWWQYSDGLSTDQHLADFVRAPYVGWLSMLTVSFDSSMLEAKILSTHGLGSSSTMTGPLGQARKLADSWPEADVVLVGHHSRKVGYPVDIMVDRGGGLQARRRILALTGGFCRGYVVGHETYVESALMQPLNQGAPVIFIRPVDREGRLDMNLLT